MPRLGKAGLGLKAAGEKPGQASLGAGQGGAAVGTWVGQVSRVCCAEWTVGALQGQLGSKGRIRAWALGSRRQRLHTEARTPEPLQPRRLGGEAGLARWGGGSPAVPQAAWRWQHRQPPSRWLPSRTRFRGGVLTPGLAVRWRWPKTVSGSQGTKALRGVSRRSTARSPGLSLNKGPCRGLSTEAEGC